MSAVRIIWLRPFRHGLPFALATGDARTWWKFGTRLSLSNGGYYRRRVHMLLSLGPAPFPPPPL